MEYGDTKVLAAAERKLSMPHVGPPHNDGTNERQVGNTQHGPDSSYLSAQQGPRLLVGNSFQPMIAQSPERSL
jgi:hypothetical protein